MKNLSVGKKLLVSFGAVVVLIGIILGVTIITSTRRDAQMEQIQALMEIQDEAVGIQADFLRGRIELRTMYTASDESSLAAYDLGLVQIALAESKLANAEAVLPRLSAEYQERYTLVVRGISPMLNQIRDGLAEINANDLEVISSVATISALFDDMADVVSDMYVLATGAISNFITAENYDPAATDDYRVNVVDSVEEMLTRVSNLRIQAALLLLNFDTSVMPEIEELIEGIKEHAGEISDAATTEAGKQAAQGIIDSATVCMEEAERMSALISGSDALIDVTRDLTIEIDGLLVAGVATITSDINNAVDDIQDSSRRAMIIQILVVAAAIVLSVAVAMLLTRSITGPLNMMKGVLLQLGGTGKMDFGQEILDSCTEVSKGKDEIAQSMAAFITTINHFTEINDTLSSIAAGDLTAQCEVLSDEDTMGKALAAVTESLNKMFQEINTVSMQVTTASQEIANGAQTLAMGSTEQAATIEQISASVNEISSQMAESANTSEESARQGMEIRNMAQEGSEKMNQMMAATREISEASSAIEKVIKVIDDIAFQTNILALNAAVEAARAGQHGKGFAVVAEEVGNLAGKSADAAKETANLISANIEKARVGLEISEETAKNLARIIDAVNQTSEGLQSMAVMSRQVTDATHQVTEAIDQVTHVVQQNSATSQQSAASSQEMNSQAQMLQELIKQFKLKDSDDFGYALPSSPAPSYSDSDPVVDSGSRGSNKYGVDGMLM